MHNAKELSAVNPKTQGAVIASALGSKKRAELLKLAAEKRIRILSSKDASKALIKINEEFNSRKKSREDKNKEKSKKLEEKKQRKSHESEDSDILIVGDSDASMPVQDPASQG